MSNPKVSTQARICIIIQYVISHHLFFFMQVQPKWVDLIVSGGKLMKYAPSFVGAIGKIIFLRANKGRVKKGYTNKGGACRAAMVVGAPFHRDVDPDKFVAEWGCAKYKNAYPIHFVLKFPQFWFDPLTYKQGCVPGLLKASSVSDLAKCRSALRSPKLKVACHL